jgi:hypothetical protein
LAFFYDNRVQQGQRKWEMLYQLLQHGPFEHAAILRGTIAGVMWASGGKGIGFRGGGQKGM